MTDHELCLAAAKAAGYTVDWNKILECFMFLPTETTWYEPWRPLDNDEDAFRLMVDCGIDVEFEKRTVVALLYGREGAADDAIEHIGTDKHAATRRAIVRAAAAMGTSDEQ